MQQGLAGGIEGVAEALNQGEGFLQASRDGCAFCPGGTAAALHAGRADAFQGCAERSVAAEPKEHAGLQHGGKAGAIEDGDPLAAAEPALWARGTDFGEYSAVAVKAGLNEGHAEGAAICAESVAQKFGLEVIEEEEDLPGRAAPESRQNGPDLMGEECDEDEIVRDAFVEALGDMDLHAIAGRFDDGVVASELRETRRPRAGDGGDLMPADLGQLEGEGAADGADAEDCDLEVRGGVVAAHAFMIGREARKSNGRSLG